jgi:predicted  nucleic acid-binding Zn-ribbon protein
LSEALKFSSSSVKGWLERETSSIFVPVHTKAQKLFDEMRESLESLRDASKILLDNSGKEIEKRNVKTYGRARALNKLARLFLDRLRQIKIPEQVSYDSIRDFAREIQSAFLVTEVDIKNWFPRISPFFIFDRRKFLAIFEKAKEQLEELNNFLTKEYVKTKVLEETFQLIDRLQVLEQQLEDLKERKIKAQTERASIEKKVSETQQKIEDLKGGGKMSQLNQLYIETEALSDEIKHVLRSLQKPFIKLQALSLYGGGGGLTPEELKKLSHYLENPFESLAAEEADYPLLRQILKKLDRAMSEGKISLKPDKRRKAEQAIDNILNKGMLTSLYKKCISVASRRKQLSTSVEVEETKLGLSRLQNDLENLQRRREVAESEENTVDQEINETSEKIRNSKASIEKNVFDFMGKKIHIE